ncbi:MAG: shikimate dehydrogenase [Flavobacteriia bacterium]|nr:shikimate dehydrogenase [Flavobacteriia bacterium]OIP48362.1 MAG: shikimate dehydrogenase [Flavobacteriaceae bacterium CG2_30_31_66]PIV96307.1 MAG: shikimate dehydrogenase [Flavobacteriaceae bacterium CG17_big_fil_post_rev_8_21_14_2_50_31_13]PIX13188.1 MAG: shikimate dehydrogenase [Flavobacteriaceae bacterium CG_4_8_14_3_um_filter_31_8]PIY13569.1 MAG: shikimate dehydrogenase [Flavobacteriaceae bacterium CG_4_10_14_3_um_filter_31_253]PIZ09446.1 MAG: shikimate dehydrogenase [Flavobacteriaceae
MTENEKDNIFGLLGRNISYSFSRGYFNEKFQRLNILNHYYKNFDIQNCQDFPSIISSEKNLKGLNVTIPYKEEIIQFLDELDLVAKEIGAVNTIKVFKNGILKGYNTDVIGFENSIKPLLKKHHTAALILGTGGASKAVAYFFKKNNVHFYFVSRNPECENEISYKDLSQEIIQNHTIIVNCSPLGTSPNINKCPEIPYEFLNSNHILYDLIYNPEETLFLSKGKKMGSTIKNGFEMLMIQAEESWRIWKD